MRQDLNLTMAEAEYSRYQDVLKRLEHGNLVMFDYYYADWSMFQASPLTREFRGVIFDKVSGRVVSRPFHKFFNVNENPETQEENLVFNGYVTEKIDGSMAQITSNNGELIIASRSSFTGYVNNAVTGYLRTQPELVEFIFANPSYTFLFEFLDPDAPIVLRPDKKELVYLNARDKFTGEYAFQKFYQAVPARSVVTQEVTPHQWENYYKPILGSIQDFEGYVLHLHGQGMYKAKTTWYVKSHRIITMYKPKNYLEIWSEGTLDDTISNLHILGHPKVAEEILAVTEAAKNLLSSRVKHLLGSGVHQGMTAKEVAVSLTKMQQIPTDKLCFSALMAAYRGGYLMDSARVLNELRTGLGKSSTRVRAVLEDLDKSGKP